MSEARTRRDPVTEQRNGSTNGRTNGFHTNAPSNSQPVMPIQQQMNMLQQQQQVNQMQMQQQVQQYDLQYGNHDLIAGVQAISGVAQSLTAMAPFLNPMIGEMVELCLEKGSDYAFIDLEVSAENAGE